MGADVTTIASNSDDDEDQLLIQANKPRDKHHKRRDGNHGSDRDGHRGENLSGSEDRHKEPSRNPPRDPKGNKVIGSGRDTTKYRGHSSNSPVTHGSDNDGKDDDISADGPDKVGHASRPTEAKKVPRPQHRPENRVPPRLAGDRPTIDPAHPNHREMILPLYVNEPVIYADPECNEPQLGVVAKTIEDPRQVVTVRPIEDDSVEVCNLTIPDFKVVKATDFLIYCGVRYAVFGPPLYSLSGLGWGHAWLDLVNERAHFHEESQAHDKLLYELKRLDCVMLKYAGIPDCPVLVLGFLQSRTDDSDWKAIGLIGMDSPEVLDNEASASTHICGMSMQTLKSEFDTTATYIVEDVCEFHMTTHPHLIQYKKAMRWIEAWSRRNPAWTPMRTWKAHLTRMYAKEFKANSTRAIQPKACPSCVSLLKKQDKTEV